VLQLPGLESGRRMYGALEGEDKAQRFAGEYTRGLVIPQLIQQLAAYQDQGAKRAPKTFIEQLMLGVPGLREQVPERRAPSRSNSDLDFLNIPGLGKR